MQLPSGEPAPLSHPSLGEAGIVLKPLHDVGAVSLEVSGEDGEDIQFRITTPSQPHPADPDGSDGSLLII